MRLSVKELLYGALLTALALLIPLAFQGWLQVVIPPFSATLASHLPSMLAMTISPWTAALVGFGSSLGFLLTLGPVVALRAAVHVLFGVAGAWVYRRDQRLWKALLVAWPIHVLGETLVVLPFGFTFRQALIVIGLGTALHHLADGAITAAVFHSLTKAGVSLALAGKGPVNHL
ncbi:MAG TPA: ECF transporter S component [Limnochordia bacterium]|nr:ECF transporter S component [Limnochordia bacterium]